MKGRKTGLWVLLTDALLLFLALISTAFGAVTVYQIEVISSALWAGAAVLAVGMVGLVNLPRYRLGAIVGTLALWGWGIWRLWEPLVWGGARLQCDLVNTIAGKIPNVTTIVPVVELPEEIWLQVTTLWILMVGVVYALALALMLCRLRRALAVILWTLIPILPALCVTEAPDALPMMGLLAVWFTLVLTSLTNRGDRSGTAKARPVAFVCVLLALSLMAERLPTEGTAQPLWAADLRETIINGASRRDLSALLTRWSGWLGSGSTEYVNLLGAAPATSSRVALRVWGDMGKYYLRGYSADVYTGRRWEPLSREAGEELESILETGVEPLLMLGEKVGETAGYRYYSYWHGEFSVIEDDGKATLKVENVAAPGGCVYYPYALAELPQDAAFGGDSHLERTGAVWEHTFTYYPDWEDVDLDSGSWYRYSMSYGSGVGVWLPVDERNGGLPAERGGTDLYREFVYAHELQVPENLRPILEDWLRKATGGIVEERYGITFASLEDYVRYAKGYMYWREQVQQRLYDEYREALQGAIWNERLYQAMVEQVWNEAPTREFFEGVEVTGEDLEIYRDWYRELMTNAVVNYLAETTRYDRDTPAPPAGRDYVDWFLNESQRGYCMHYATAATLLLRTAGIPARYVSGYVAHIPWRAESTEVTGHAAHAWVEIYVDGVGWYPLEVTPGFQSNGMGDIPALDSEAAVESAEPSAAPSAAHSEEPEPSEEPEIDEEPSEEPDEEPEVSQAPVGQVGSGEGDGERASVPAGVWYGLGLLGLVALVVFGRRVLLTRRRERLLGEDTNAAVLYAYVCHGRLKAWGGQDSGELTELAEKARFSQHILTGDERERALCILEEETRRVYDALPGWKKVLFVLVFGKGE